MALEAGISVLSRFTSMLWYSPAGQRPGRQVQVAADGLGDLADGHAFVADSVEDRTGGSLLDSAPVETRGVLHVDSGPAGDDRPVSALDGMVDRGGGQGSPPRRTTW